MTRFLFIAGHGNQRDGSFDPGATGYITKGEYRYMVQDLFPAIRRNLPSNADVVFYDARKVSNWGNLQAIVNQYKADEVVEFHFDAHTTGSSARGGHVIIHSAYAPDKVDLALRDAIQSMCGVRYSHRGHTGISGRNNLYNVNDARSRGITYRLLELGFGTNRTDANIMTGRVNNYAKAIVRALFGSVGSGSSKSKSNNSSDGWQTNRHGTQYLATKGKFTVGNQPITVRVDSPFRSAKTPRTSQIQPGTTITYHELVRQDGLIWIGFRTGQGGLRYLPVRTWNSRTGAVGPAWGTFS